MTTLHCRDNITISSTSQPPLTHLLTQISPRVVRPTSCHSVAVKTLSTLQTLS